MKALLWLIASGFVWPAFAETANTSNTRLHWNGFASQAFVHTSDNRFFGDSDNGSFDFTEIGLNGSYLLSPRLRLAGQVLSRRAGDLYSGSPQVDYALLDATLFSSAQSTFGMYLGRIKNPIGLYNETRDVAHTREGIFLPQAIYFDKVRNLTVSSDGLHLYGRLYRDSGTWSLQGGIGYPIVDKNFEYAYMGQDWDGKIRSNDLAAFGRLLYEHNGGRWIYAFTGASVRTDFRASGADTVAFPAGPGLNSGNIDIDYSVFSAQFNGEKWQFTTEVAFQAARYRNISAAFEAQDFNSIGYYSQLSYNFTSRWQGFVRYEEFQLNHDDWNASNRARQNREESAFLANFGIDRSPIPAHAYYSKIWAFGGHWDVTPQWRVRAEYQIVEGTATLSPRENDMSQTDKHWNLFALSLSYHF
ncbi:hypothetical protein [Methylophaga muralis]|uniref:Uncharacterized protein n=1 Tax=Methylophaga muralis TaxID=291169 RepID=A0A1E3GUP6_9GAMM|nr:hypothetical protein [Methylophaga muralis]ODN67798.1 hypothetical protein A9E74_00634 [Methylophaga muralis]